MDLAGAEADLPYHGGETLMVEEPLRLAVLLLFRLGVRRKTLSHKIGMDYQAVCRIIRAGFQSPDGAVKKNEKVSRRKK